MENPRVELPVYGTDDASTVAVIAYENLKKPQIRAEIVGLLRLSMGLFVTQHTINLRYRAKCSMG
mgnify:CR=1 FL=1